MNSKVYSIIDRWPTRADLAADLAAIVEKEVDVAMVHKWAMKGIPAWWQQSVLHAAERRGITLTADEMVEAHHEKGVSA